MSQFGALLSLKEFVIEKRKAIRVEGSSDIILWGN